MNIYELNTVIQGIQHSHNSKSKQVDVTDLTMNHDGSIGIKTMSSSLAITTIVSEIGIDLLDGIKKTNSDGNPG